MKAQFIAVALSLSIATFAHAQTNLEKSPSPVSVQLPSKIDLNKANLSALIGSFKGIGKKRAEAIIAYRESHKGFKSLEELAEVKGLGQHFMLVNRDKLKEIFVIN